MGDCAKSIVDILKSIQKYSVLANAIKHGEGNSMNNLKNNYSEFFSIENNEISIDEVHIQEFYETLVQFWKYNPDSIVFDYEGFKNNTKLNSKKENSNV